ncbi:MAG TPA: SUMF1/EgtB/PvdO family nonheme iron enzyme [Chitinophagales bacterium]
MKKSAFLILLTTGLLSFSADRDNYQQQTPPGTIQVSKKLYCDISEISNTDWKEYMNWTKIVFGETSAEYKATKPDETVWSQDSLDMGGLSEEYFRLPIYKYNPVVGITQKQAMAYAKWRSDRVFERILIDFKELPNDQSRMNRDNYFTTEKYYASKFTPENAPKLEWYPEYHLPTLDQRDLILHQNDSIGEQLARKAKQEYLPPFYANVLNDFSKKEITISTSNPYYSLPAKNAVLNLRGNVSEWTDEEDVAVGGSWHETPERIMQSDNYEYKKPNAWTGFRCVFEWKKN